VTYGVRASGVVVRGRVHLTQEAAASGAAQVMEVQEGPGAKITPASWPELLAWLKSPQPAWYHISAPKPEDLDRLAAATNLPRSFLDTHLLATSYAHAVQSSRYLALFVWLPELHANAPTDRYGVLFLAREDGLLSLSRRPTRLLDNLNEAPAEVEEEPRPYARRMLETVVQGVLRQNERLIADLEQGLRALEEIPVRESSPQFFENTFRLKKELSAAQSDLWRLKGVVADLAAARVKIPGDKAGSGEGFARFASKADYLYETVVNLREEVLSVIELHLNVVSFDMNRVMRVLAVVSVLGLIPAVVGGLFGMNLADNPWPFTLPQVSFCVGFGMLVTLYFFFVKGWLR
jgi:Mg2+ and Co2+ transporter CorA